MSARYALSARFIMYTCTICSYLVEQLCLLLQRFIILQILLTFMEMC